MNKPFDLILCKTKVLAARVTESKTRYWASLEMDSEILRAAGVYDYEKVLVVNVATGARMETYVKSAPAGSRRVVLAGGMARLAEAGDEIGFLSFAVVSPEAAEHWKPKVVALNPDNSIRSVTDGDPATWE